LPTFPASGSTLCTAAARREALDTDSSVSPTHGEQEMSVWNGYYACTCYHPLFVFNQFGDLERSVLRPGSVHSADGWDGTPKPAVAPYQGKVLRINFGARRIFVLPKVTVADQTELLSCRMAGKTRI